MTLEAPAFSAPIDSEWSESLQLMRAIELNRSGDLLGVRTLLVEICRRNRDSELGWLWLASITKSPAEGIECIKHVLRINPDNRAAREWMRKFVERHSQPKPAEPKAEAVSSSRPLGRMSEVVARLRQDGKIGTAGPTAAPRRTPVLLKVTRSTKPAVAAAQPETAVKQDLPVNTEPAEQSPKASVVERTEHAEQTGATPAVIESAISSASESTCALEADDGTTASEPAASEEVQTQPAEQPAPIETPATEPFTPEKDSSLPAASPNPEETAPAPKALAPSQLAAQTEPPPAKTGVRALAGFQARLAALAAKPAVPAADLLAASDKPAPRSSSLLERLTSTGQAIEQPRLDFDNCPLCAAKLKNPTLCGDCGASVWPSDPLEFFTNRSVNRERLSKTISLLEIGRIEFRTEMRLALAYCNRLQFAQARARLQNAMVQSNQRTWPVSQRTTEFLKRPTVLVVDDSATIRDVLIRLLHNGGFLPIPVADSWDVKATVVAESPAAVLLDVTMPIMDGYEVCRQLRADKAFKSLPVIMVSGHEGLINRVSGKLAGATDYVCKPFKPDQLLSLIRKHAAKAT